MTELSLDFDLVNSALSTHETTTLDALIQKAELIKQYLNTARRESEKLEKVQAYLDSEKKSIEHEIVEYTNKLAKLRELYGEKSVARMSVPDARSNGKNPMWDGVIVKKNSKRMVVPGLKINAFDIENPSQCHQHKGYWCWCPSIMRYCISINDNIIYSHFCEFLKEGDKPYKCREHRDMNNPARARSVVSTETDFYVPPEVVPTSRDTRRFHSTLKLSGKDRYIKYADIETLEEDILNGCPTDVRLASDLAGTILLGVTTALEN